MVAENEVECELGEKDKTNDKTGESKKIPSPKSVASFESSPSRAGSSVSVQSRFLNRLSKMKSPSRSLEYDGNREDIVGGSDRVQLGYQLPQTRKNGDCDTQKSSNQIRNEIIEEIKVKRREWVNTIWSPDNEFQNVGLTRLSEDDDGDDDDKDDDDTLIKELETSSLQDVVEITRTLTVSSSDDDLRLESQHGMEHIQKNQKQNHIREKPSLKTKSFLPFEDEPMPQEEEECFYDKTFSDDSMYFSSSSSEEEDADAETTMASISVCKEVKQTNQSSSFSTSSNFSITPTRNGQNEDRNFFSKIEPNKDNDSNWYDPECFPSSQKKQIYEQKESDDPFNFGDDNIYFNKNNRKICFDSENGKDSKLRFKENVPHDMIFTENAGNSENDNDSYYHLEGSEIEPSISFLTKFRKGKLGRFVKIFQFKNNGEKRKKEKKKRRLFPRGRNKKRKKEDEEEIEDKNNDEKEKDLSKSSDDMEGDPDNFYRQLSDNDEIEAKSGNKKHEDNMNHSRNYWKSAQLYEI